MFSWASCFLECFHSCNQQPCKFTEIKECLHKKIVQIPNCRRNIVFRNQMNMAMVMSCETALFSELCAYLPPKYINILGNCPESWEGANTMNDHHSIKRLQQYCRSLCGTARNQVRGCFGQNTLLTSVLLWIEHLVG